MKLSNIILLILFVLTLGSCLGKIDIKIPEPLIKEEIMLEIMSDLHRADGILKIPYISNEYKMKDSVEVYMEIIEKYGYSKEQFDANIDYYFVAKPKVMNSIYENLLERLSRMEDENIKNTSKEKKPTVNLWIGTTTYRLPDIGTSNAIEFSIPISNEPGLYKLSYRALIHEDDQSDSLSTNIYFWYDDGTEKGSTLAWDKYIYEKNGKSNSLSFDKELIRTEFTHLKGKLLEHKAKSGHWEMHSSISGINLTFSPDNKFGKSTHKP